MMSKLTVIVDSVCPHRVAEMQSPLSLEKALFQALGLKGNFPYAAFDAVVDGHQPCLKLTPISVEASHNNVVLVAYGEDLAMTSDEEQAIQQAISPLLEQDGFALMPNSKGGWLVIGNHQAKTTPIFEVGSRPLTDCLPRGEDALYWHRLFSECQMAISSLSFNGQRAQQGLPEVNGVWFWGEGELPEVARTVQVITDDRRLQVWADSEPNMTLIDKACLDDVSLLTTGTPTILFTSHLSSDSYNTLRQLNKNYDIAWYWRDNHYFQPAKSTWLGWLKHHIKSFCRFR